jgi:hypothetical protein
MPAKSKKGGVPYNENDKQIQLSARRGSEKVRPLTGRLQIHQWAQAVSRHVSDGHPSIRRYEVYAWWLH